VILSVLLPLAGVFPLGDSAHIGRRRLRWTAARARGIWPVVVALVESLLLFLPRLRWLAAVGAVVPVVGSKVGSLTVLAFEWAARR